jgi:hypothetical protein
MSYYTDAIEVVKRLANARLDEAEQATLVLILLVHSGRLNNSTVLNSI